MQYPPLSDSWPLNYVLDEIYLKSRRSLIYSLEKNGFWPSNEEHQKFLKRQQTIGEMIKTETLRNILGESDYILLNSGTIFGVNNIRFKKRLPYVASFGYEIGLMLYTLLNEKCNEHSFKIPEITSIFNICISLFDFIQDETKGNFKEVTNIINYKTINKIFNDKYTCENLLIKCKNLNSVESRLLSKITLSFVLRLHAFYDKSDKRKLWKVLMSYIMSAYLAEIKSSQLGCDEKGDLLEISYKKSTLPFIIICYIVFFITASNYLETDNKKIYKISKTIGEIFWYVDDLIDLLKDLKNNHLNSILNNAYKRVEYKNENDKKQRVLIELLDGCYIEETVNQIRLKIMFISRSLDVNNFNEESIRFFKSNLFCFVRSWLG
jgi:hypothetical protein